MTRILLIDDDDAVREVTTEVLRQAGHTVTAAPNAKTGLAHQHTDPHDLIITDINMPVMDGLKLVRRVRSDPLHKETPISIITTEGSQEDRQRALQLGANAYITKPIQAPQVIAKVKELLNV